MIESKFTLPLEEFFSISLSSLFLFFLQCFSYSFTLIAFSSRFEFIIWINYGVELNLSSLFLSLPLYARFRSTTVQYEIVVADLNNLPFFSESLVVVGLRSLITIPLSTIICKESLKLSSKSFISTFFSESPYSFCDLWGCDPYSLSYSSLEHSSKITWKRL